MCTAGFKEDGTWRRIYPIRFRKKSYNEKYKKYDWIEVDLVKNTSDFRPDSYRPKSFDSEIKVIGHIDTTKIGKSGRKLLRKIYYNLSGLIAEAKNKQTCTSLAVFKPTEILDFTAELADRKWDKDKLAKLNQLNLFETNKAGKFEVVQKFHINSGLFSKTAKGLKAK